MSEDLCKHELLLSTCTDCEPKKPPKPRSALREMARSLRRTMRAGFDSNCPGCGTDIYEGDTITLDDGDWVCEDCAQ